MSQHAVANNSDALVTFEVDPPPVFRALGDGATPPKDETPRKRWVDWNVPRINQKQVLCIHVLVGPPVDGERVAFAPTLPGVATQGHSVEEVAP